MNFIRGFAFLSMLFILGGCSTVFHGSTQPVTFNSEPEGADVVVDGNLMGKTPTTINLKKSKIKNVMIKKAGYETTTVPLSTAYDNLTLLNVFWDCSTTDLVTGNAYEYEPSAYNVRLVSNAKGKKEAE